MGIVRRGSKRASVLGFPTANIAFRDADTSGIYAAHVKIGTDTHLAAGFADQKRNILEVHILDFSGNLYDKEITVELLEKIRDNKKFENDDVLRVAIADDVVKIRAYFRNL